MDGLSAGELEEIHNSEILKKVTRIVQDNKSKHSKTKTGNFWIKFQDMINIMKDFLTAERTGNWKLHLKILMKMIPYFASAGHNNYLKSTYLYLQNMNKLEDDKPDVYDKFLSGYHVIRRSDTFWGGLSCDLVIEQDLMRTMKSSGNISMFYELFKFSH